MQIVVEYDELLFIIPYDFGEVLVYFADTTEHKKINLNSRRSVSGLTKCFSDNSIYIK